MTRRPLRTLCWVLVGALLYGQLAIAAYACPRLAPAAAAELPMVAMNPATDSNVDNAAAPVSAQSGDCAGMLGSLDSSDLKLCADHCNYGHQSDQTPQLTLPTLLLTALYILPAIPTLFASPQAAVDATRVLAAADPPHAILHCCFRI